MSWQKFSEFDRCDAPPDNLDRPNSHRRTHEKTDFLISAWDPATLWSDFGVRTDIVVRSPHLFERYILNWILVAVHTWFPSS